jgi:hypothetical protein
VSHKDKQAVPQNAADFDDPQFHEGRDLHQGAAEAKTEAIDEKERFDNDL